jgi:hypothetical protein
MIVGNKGLVVSHSGAKNPSPEPSFFPHQTGRRPVTCSVVNLCLACGKAALCFVAISLPAKLKIPHAN